MNKKNKIVKEFLDKDGNIITKHSMGPENSPNNITMSTQITDYNINVASQKFDDQQVASFGFTKFFESEEKEEKKLIDILAELEFEQYKSFLNYFIDNFSKENLKKWKETASKSFDKLSAEEKKSDYDNAKKVVKAIKKYVESKNEDTLNEDLVQDKKEDKELVDKILDKIEKKNDKELSDKKVKAEVEKILKDSKK